MNPLIFSDFGLSICCSMTPSPREPKDTKVAGKVPLTLLYSPPSMFGENWASSREVLKGIFGGDMWVYNSDV